MSQPEAIIRTSKAPWIISGSFIGLLLACYFLWPAFQETINEAWQVLTSGDQERISRWVSQFGFWGPVFIIGFMVAQMFLVVVNVVALMVVAVLAYGPVWGSVISIGGIFVASTVGYLLGRGLGPATIGKFLGAKTQEKVAEQVERYGIWAVVLARISPIISNDAISIVAGIVRMPYGKFMLATAGGIIPLTLLIAYLGQNIDRLKTGLIVVSVVGVVALIAYYIYDRQRRKKQAKQD
ncbi:TVP38/TMEM64 family protein [Adhaeribacter swui]|uniref:TVP38/TMEM64 family protein n=1 Tax=Adhaeribacter swui TaxID=2086471 RepID=UPI0037427F7C